MTRLRRLALPALAAVTVAAIAWIWPIDGRRPLYAWFPGEVRLSGSMMKAIEASNEVRLVAAHKPNLVVLQADDAWFAFRLLVAGGVPLAMNTESVLCRPADG